MMDIFQNFLTAMKNQRQINFHSCARVLYFNRNYIKHQLAYISLFTSDDDSRLVKGNAGINGWMGYDDVNDEMIFFYEDFYKTAQKSAFKNHFRLI